VPAPYSPSQIGHAYLDRGYRSFEAITSLNAYTLVKVSTGDAITACDETEQPVGVLHQAAAQGDEVLVALLSKVGTVRIKTAGAITRGTRVYGVDDGLVADAVGSSRVCIGIALEAATAAGDVVEVMPL